MKEFYHLWMMRDYPGFPNVIDFLIEDKQLYIILERVKGWTLEDSIKSEIAIMNSE